ncbi:MAG: ATP-dependent RNA helicase HrpA [Planctomycetes bacterium]|nr:ATP-dependent RNA helicase HrpA [Planctomycetota bacterium]
MLNLDAISKDIPTAMLADQQRLRRLVRAVFVARRDRREPAHVAQLEAHLRQEMTRSVHMRRDRATNIPVPKLDQDLPILTRKDEILAAIRDHQVVVICGETGSGKTTQLPQLCLTLGRGVAGLIGHTQPRRIAARSVAARIAEELGTTLSQASRTPGKGTAQGPVGFKVRFGDNVGESTFIKVMTDGILLAETQSDQLLSQYDTLIIDEAHERSLNIDFLLGYLKTLLPKRPDFKLIITSATIDPQKFAKHFATHNIPAPIIEVSGRTYPVEIRYRPPEDDPALETIDDAVVKACRELLDINPYAADGRHDVLVFLPTERDIRSAAEALSDTFKSAVEILPLFARLSTGEQMRVFSSHRGRRIVLATNVAETSLTVPGIRYVVDVGTARLSRYSHKTKVQRLPVEAISRASADQRAGRCGRVAEGVCIRLYSEKDFQTRDRFTEPEILRTNLASVILRMKALNLGDIESFPFVDAPEGRMIRDGLQTLHELGALTHEEGDKAHLTDLGRQIAKLPIDPRIARMIIAGDREHCLDQILVLAAALSIQDPRERPLDRQQDADAAHARFAHETSDFLSLLNLWNFYEKKSAELSSSKLRKLCQTSFLSWTRMREWEDVHRQLQDMAQELKLRHSGRHIHEDFIHRAIMTGLLSNLGIKGETHEYTGARHMKFSIFPGSGLFKKNPKWIMAAEIVHTTRTYGRTVAKIDPNWIEPLAAHVIKHSYTNIFWQREIGQIGAFERVTLFGLEIVAKRRVHFGPIEPKECRALFIHHALVEQDSTIEAPFMGHNKELVESVRTLESKARAHDILADNESVFAFYDSRLPSDIYTTGMFEKWRKEAERRDPRLLFMTPDHIMKRTASDITPDSFPDSLTLGGAKLKLDYNFAPGESDDGLTLRVPIEALGQVDEARCEWLIPGRLEDKITALLRTLPKQLRKDIEPLGPLATAAAQELSAPQKFAKGSLPHALADIILRTTRVRIDPALFNPLQVPPHLRMNIIVLDAQGQEIARGRDVIELHQRLLSQVQESFRALSKQSFDRTGITRWDVGTLQPEISFTRGNSTILGFPALVDEGKDVSLRLLDTKDAATNAHRAGVRRLIYMACKDALLHATRGMSTLPQIVMRYAEFGKPEDLKLDLQLLIADRAFLGTFPLPRTESDFQATLKLGRASLASTAKESEKLVSQILTARHAVALAMASSPPPSWTQPIADINDQLTHLTPRHFLLTTPWERLAHLPRYLNAIQYRLHKLGMTGIARDQKWMFEVLPHWRRYTDAIKEPAGIAARHPDALSDYRWMVEEFRVSLFAQELGTAGPISAKRLDEAWARIGR